MIMGKPYEAEQQRRRWFVPSLSFDGVAMVVAIVMAIRAYGDFSQWRTRVDMQIENTRLDVSRIESATSDLDRRTSSLEVSTGVKYRQPRETKTQ